jgi:hypothetical protein
MTLKYVAAQNKGIYYLDDGLLYGDSEIQVNPLKLRENLMKLGLRVKESKCD